MQLNKNKWLFYILSLVSTVGFFIDSGGRTPPNVPHLDKLAHFIVFMILTVSLCRAYTLSSTSVFSLALIYGIAIEYLQSLTPHRMGSTGDVIADIAGAVCGLFLFHYLNNKNDGNSLKGPQ